MKECVHHTWETGLYFRECLVCSFIEGQASGKWLSLTPQYLRRIVDNAIYTNQDEEKRIDDVIRKVSEAKLVLVGRAIFRQAALMKILEADKQKKENKCEHNWKTGFYLRQCLTCNRFEGRTEDYEDYNSELPAWGIIDPKQGSFTSKLGCVVWTWNRDNENIEKEYKENIRIDEEIKISLRKGVIK